MPWPTNPGPDFNGIVDVLTQKFYKFKDENGNYEELEIPAEYADQAEEMRAELMEKAAYPAEPVWWLRWQKISSQEPCRIFLFSSCPG